MWFLYAEILVLVASCFAAGAVLARIAVRLLVDAEPTGQTDSTTVPPEGAP